MMIDVDHFKDYNDEFSHLAGDEALTLIGECLQTHQSDVLTFYRYGGEEFLAVMTPSKDEQLLA